jgi:hypothetical protein
MTQIVRANPKFGPVLLGKYDLFPLNINHAVRLDCLLPPSDKEEPLVAIPLVTAQHKPHRLEHYINISGDITSTTPTIPIPHHRYNQFYEKPIANTESVIVSLSVLLVVVARVSGETTVHHANSDDGESDASFDSIINRANQQGAGAV